MTRKLPILLSACLWAGTAMNGQAQSVASFDDLSLPGVDTNFATTQPVGDYTFESGNVRFYGELSSWGGFANFNYSNDTDTSSNFMNDEAAVTDGGVDGSENYAVDVVLIDFMNPDPELAKKTIPSGIKLINEAAGNVVAGAYFTNTAYAYGYVTTPAFVDSNHYFLLTIRGYLNGVATTDSVNFVLADYRDTNHVAVNTWEWVDLTPLGAVDSLTFDVSSSDAGDYGINVPAYFAMDDMITWDSVAPHVVNISVSDITDVGATVSWNRWTGDTAVKYYCVIDESPTAAPTGTLPALASDTFLTATGLSPNTLYYAHVQAVHPFGSQQLTSQWDTVSFTTLSPIGINTVDENNLDFTLTPNPARATLTIRSEAPVMVRIFDLSGRLIMTQAQAKEIDIRNLAPGVYYLRAYDRKNHQTGTKQFTKL